MNNKKEKNGKKQSRKISIKMGFTKSKKGLIKLLVKNAKMRQNPKEKSAYYQEDSVCVLPMNISTKEYNYSQPAMTDCTYHKTPAVMTSIHEVIDDLTENGVKRST